jgi:hypothetical protein
MKLHVRLFGSIHLYGLPLFFHVANPAVSRAAWRLMAAEHFCKNRDRNGREVPYQSAVGCWREVVLLRLVLQLHIFARILSIREHNRCLRKGDKVLRLLLLRVLPLSLWGWGVRRRFAQNRDQFCA